MAKEPRRIEPQDMQSSVAPMDPAQRPDPNAAPPPPDNQLSSFAAPEQHDEPPVAETAQEERTFGDALEAPRKPIERVPFGDLRLKLKMPAPRPDFTNHIFNDWPGRIEDALAAGYTHVKDKNGEPISRVVGVREGGGPLHGYLMEIPTQYYEEDHARGQARVDEVDAAIYGGQVEGQEGSDNTKRYVPEHGISITHKTAGDPYS